MVPTDVTTQLSQMSVAEPHSPPGNSNQRPVYHQHHYSYQYQPQRPQGRRKSSATSAQLSQQSQQSLQQPQPQQPRSPNPNPIDVGIPPSSAEWNERGAATLVKNERDENGQVTTKVIKKGVQDFNFGKTLGEGSYSTVVMGSDRQTLREYAIKVLDKRHIIKEKKVKYVNIEKNTLNRLGDHPGVIRLYYTFQDEQSLYFVLDFAPNGELLSLIKRMGSLDEDCTRYYATQLLDAVEFMHSKGVVHRDLKPENILLDDKMRIRITDFGTAKLMDVVHNEDGSSSYPPDVRANSFVGTAEYVSPELLTDKHVGKACDIWAYGCVLFQMIAGRPPFKATNEYQTFQKIIKLQYSYPPGFSMVVRDVVKRALVLNPSNRPSIDQIKRLELFESVDWSNRKSIWGRPPPRLQPFKPQSRMTPGPKPGFIPPQQHYHQIHQGQQRQHQQQSQNNKNALNAAALAASKNAVNSATAAAAALNKQPQHQAPPAQPAQPAQTAQQQQTSTKSNSSQTQNGVRPAPQTRKSTSQLNGEYFARQQQSQEAPRKTPSHNQLRSTSEPQAQMSQPPTLDPSQVGDGTPQLPQLDNVQDESKTSQHLSQTSESQPQKVDIPPHTKLDAEWNSVLQNYDERVLKIGHVNLVTSNSHNPGGRGDDEESSDKEQSKLSKFFTGARRKKRRLMITSFGRMLIFNNDGDRKIRAEVPLNMPQVLIREHAYNKQKGFGSFNVEAYNKVYTVEDSNGTAAWMDAVKLAKQLYAQQNEKQHSANYTTAAHAAALATGSAQAHHPPQHQALQPPVANDGSNSAFLQRNEEWKSKRRAN